MIDASKYRPSKQVRTLVTMINEHRYNSDTLSEDSGERRFHMGTRHGLNLAFRALVELETGITEPDDLDGLCDDLIEDAQANRHLW